MSDWEIYTHCGTLVYVSRDAYSFVQLGGYSGGLQFGMSDSLVDLNENDDGIIRKIKATTQGVESNIAVRRIIGDEGQGLVRQLCPINDEGHGFMRAVYPDGRTLTAEGIFHSRNENPVDGGQAQGFTFSFSQQEPTIED
jgi:hypothetical protein